MKRKNNNAWRPLPSATMGAEGYKKSHATKKNHRFVAISVFFV